MVRFVLSHGLNSQFQPTIFNIPKRELSHIFPSSSSPSFSLACLIVGRGTKNLNISYTGEKSKFELTEFHSTTRVNNIDHKFDLYSDPFYHSHGEFAVRGKECDKLNPDLHEIIIAKVNADIGITPDGGQFVTFKPDGVKSLKDVDKCYVQFGHQPTILSDPRVKVLEEVVLELKKDIDHLKSRITEPMRHRQLIEKKRCNLWNDHGTVFTQMCPDRVVENTRFSTLEMRDIKYSQPKFWCEFLFYVRDLIVEEKSAILPTYWSVLGGGEEGAYYELSEAIHSLPTKEDFLRSLHPKGLYADLFADIYGSTVEECLAKNIKVKPETDSGYADNCMPRK